MTMLHGYGVVGSIAVLIGSLIQAASEYRTRGHIINDHNSFRDLRKQALGRIPFFARRKRRRAVEDLQRAQVWTAEDQREYRRTMRSMHAWSLIVIGTLYAVVVSTASP